MELAESLAKEYSAPVEDVGTQLAAALYWHGWLPDLDREQVELIRESVATWGDELEDTA
ncbi:hypothetical protein [Dietzia timorensis]|uniref:hypothetical protein n=1 Tax=Dietzia timorensis TaxID=499555 RepID=UPI0012E8D168|nr:hypothetical protein [Dietzia timorensis]